MLPGREKGVDVIRAFIGIALPDGHAEALERLQDSLPLGRAAPPENFHLTLAFLGEQPEHLLEEVHYRLEDLRAPAATLEIAGLGTFGKRDASVVFAEVAQDATLRQLREKVRNAVRGAGLDLARERFRPHVTLARIGGRLEPEDLERLRGWLERNAAFRLPPVPVTEITLYRSTLTRSGALHDPLARYAIG